MIELKPAVDIRSIPEGEFASLYILEVSEQPDDYDAEGNPLWHFKIDNRYVVPAWLSERLDGWLRQMGYAYKGLERPASRYADTHNEVWGIAFIAEGNSVVTLALLEEGVEHQAQRFIPSRSFQKETDA